MDVKYYNQQTDEIVKLLNEIDFTYLVKKNQRKNILEIYNQIIQIFPGALSMLTEGEFCNYLHNRYEKTKKAHFDSEIISYITFLDEENSYEF